MLTKQFNKCVPRTIEDCNGRSRDVGAHNHNQHCVIRDHTQGASVWQFRQTDHVPRRVQQFVCRFGRLNTEALQLGSFLIQDRYFT